MRTTMTCRNEGDRIGSILLSIERLTALQKGFHYCWSLLVASTRRWLQGQIYVFTTIQTSA
jgi:hypothetical protein